MSVLSCKNVSVTIAGIQVANHLDLDLKPGQTIKMDVGYVFGNAKGAGKAVRRAYLNNNSFTANVVDDIPHESRLEPAQWGEATVE